MKRFGLLLRSSVPTAAALGATLILFGVLLSVRGPRDQMVLPPPEPTRLRFLPLAEGSPAAAVRDIWSPVMFSGAVASGFGRDREAVALIRPPLEPPVPSPLFLSEPRPVDGTAPPPEIPSISHRPVCFQRALRAQITPLEAPPPVRWSMELPESWDEEAVKFRPWPEHTRRDVAWESVVWFTVAPNGWPRHVLIESSTHPEINPELVRALRAWRLAPSTGIRDGRVRIRFDPEGPEEEA